jgi:hypothetical protein
MSVKVLDLEYDFTEIYQMLEKINLFKINSRNNRNSRNKI